MLRQYVQKIVSRISNSNASASKSRARSAGLCARKPLRERSLRLERLEDRALLSVSTAEYAEIRATYPDLNLPENVGKINVVDVIITTDSAESLANLKKAIDDASESEEPDLIVVRTSESANVIKYADSNDAITISAEQNSDVINIVAFGDKPLTINANRQSNVLTIANGNVGIANLTITGGGRNTAGGGINCQVGVSVTTINTTISNNISVAGGGVAVSKSIFKAINTTISDNTANNSGGGVYKNNGSFTAINTTISGNTSKSSHGGGVYCTSNGRAALLINTTVVNNTAGKDGGGVHVTGGCSCVAINTTIAGNYASLGSGVFNNDDSCFTAINTIIARQKKSALASSNGEDIANNGVFAGYYSLSSFTEWTDVTSLTGEKYDRWRNSLSSLTGWINNSNNADDRNTNQVDEGGTLFKNAENGDYSLAEGALKAIDLGSNAYLDDVKIETDFAGNSRIAYKTVDIGAYEYSKTITVDPSEGFVAFAQAIKDARDDDTIKFTESSTSQVVSFTDTIALEKSINIDGTGANVAFDGGDSTRLFDVSKGATLTLRSVTLQNGKGAQGGAIRNAGTLTLNGVAFLDNVSTNSGGAVFNDTTGTLTMVGGTTTFDGNTSGKGGAIANYGTTTLKGGVKATFVGNSAVQYGGAYFGCGTLNVKGIAIFDDNQVTSNASKGGAIYSGVYRFDDSTTYRGQISITGGAVFNNNQAKYRGGSIVTYGDPSQDYASLDVYGVAAFAGNSAVGSDSYGGAIDVGKNAKATFAGTLTFEGNGKVDGIEEPVRVGFGGAIFSAGSLSFGKDGTYTFINNESARSGGAIDACNYEETPGDDYVAGLLALNGDFAFYYNKTFGADDAGLGGAIATAAPTTVGENTTFYYEGNKAPRGNCVAVDTISVAANKNLRPEDFGLTLGDDYTTFVVLRQDVASAVAAITPSSIAPKAVVATITVEGVSKTFGMEGFVPQDFGLGEGVYEALVQYEDASGKKSSVYSFVLTVEKGATLDVRETSVANGRGVKFNFNLNKDGRAVSVWEISWGDGTTTRSERLSSSWTTAHYYAKDGAFDVSLTAVYLDGTSETFEGFSTQKIGTTLEPEVLATCFNEIEDVFDQLDDLVPYGPSPRKR